MCPHPLSMHHLVCNIPNTDCVIFKRYLKYQEPNILVNPSADQFNAILHSVLEKHTLATKYKVTNSVISLVQFGQQGASRGKESSSGREEVESFWSRHS